MTETRWDTGRQSTVAKHTYKLTDEQVATIGANRIIAEARREALHAQSYQCEQNKQKQTEEASETALEEQHEICDDDAWEELNGLMLDDELEDAFDHILLDMDTSASTANLPSESEPERAHAVQQNCAVAPAASWAS